MLNTNESRRRASQPLVTPPPRLNLQTLHQSSSFLLAKLNVFRPRAKRTANDADSQWEAQRDSNMNPIRRVSVVSRSCDSKDADKDPNVAKVSAIPTIRREQSDKVLRWSDINTGDETDEAETSSSEKSSMCLWKQLAPTTKSEANQVTVMYSISFYPWKMEPHCYYSHPEAAANWVPDTASTRCQTCLAAFTLTRRRHHCRLCGHLVCANCSHDRTYLPFTGSAPSQHRLIKDGAPQRTCSSCASTLHNMAAQDDSRVKRFTIAVSSARQRTPVASALSISSARSVVAVDVERPSPWLRRTGLAFTDSDVEDEDVFTKSTAALQLDRGSHRPSHHCPVRLSAIRAGELDDILSAQIGSHALSAAVDRRGNSSVRQFVISSAWLHQWLRYVRVNPNTTEGEAANSSSTQQVSYENYRNKAQHHKSTVKCRLARAPRPGHVANYILLDFMNGELVPKPNLQRSRGSHVGGDYRVVSQEVWTAFLGLYGGGPSIQVSLSNAAAVGTMAPKLDQPRPSARPPWTISELDNSFSALATSSPIDNCSSTLRESATQRREKEVMLQSIQNTSTRSMARRHSAHGKHLVSAASISTHVVRQRGGTRNLRSSLPCQGLARPGVGDK
uniref:FYVE-type domain-containing protein n=1 Tax=Hyaloperonospora arabidopsidis (strain Emoy2) TaxID=559515 RepID=M4B5K7_HYAAE